VIRGVAFSPPFIKGDLRGIYVPLPIGPDSAEGEEGIRGSPCPSVLRPQGRRKGISLDPEIFGIKGHPEGDTGGLENLNNPLLNFPPCQGGKLLCPPDIEDP